MIYIIYWKAVKGIVLVIRAKYMVVSNFNESKKTGLEQKNGRMINLLNPTIRRFYVYQEKYYVLINISFCSVIEYIFISFKSRQAVILDNIKTQTENITESLNVGYSILSSVLFFFGILKLEDRHLFRTFRWCFSLREPNLNNCRKVVLLTNNK